MRDSTRIAVRASDCSLDASAMPEPCASVTDDALHGSCLCAQIRVTVKRPADVKVEDWTIPAHNCHCEVCSRTGGSLIVTWLTVPRDGFEIDDPKGLIKTYESSPGVKRTFVRQAH